LQAAREKIKAEKLAKTDDWRRRTAQARTYKTPDEHAMCGIRWYCRSQKDRDTGCYWHNCHKCFSGPQALVTNGTSVAGGA
jgi:hypothetical protein